MFLMTTRERPLEVRDMIAAMRATGHVPDVWVRIDGPPFDGYRELDWPANWCVTYADEQIELTAAINRLMAANPGQKFYGFFGDHFRPLTPFADALMEAAGEWFMAWPCDGGSSYRQPAGCPTFGPKLIEALGGWIMLPTTVHCCTDRVWWHLWRTVGNVRHVEAVRFTRTWPIGTGAGARYYNGRDYTKGDYAAWIAWERDEAPQACARIRAGMKADGFTFDAEGRVDARHGVAPFKEGW